MKRSMTASLIRYSISTGAVACIVAAYFRPSRVNATINETTVALTFLIAILVVSANWGVRHAIYLSFLSSAAFNFFFLPPVLTFTIRDSRNWVALGAFLVTAIIASQLAEKARTEATISRRRQREAERISNLSQQMLVSGSVLDLLKDLPQMIATGFNLAGAAVYLRDKDSLYRSHPDYSDMTKAELRNAAFTRDHHTDQARGITLVPILLGTRPIGAVGMTGVATTRETLNAVSGLVAIAIERAGAVDTLSKVEAARESERLRNALLDSVAHDLRTPLTSITAAIAALRSGAEVSPVHAAELLHIIDDETSRLSRLVGEALEMAELEAKEIHLDLAPHSMRETVDGAIESVMHQMREHPIDIRIAPALPPAVFDQERIGKVLQHLLENAAMYSPETSPIFISAEAANGKLVTSVADRGVGVDDLERMMIFDKFYRGQGQRNRVRGTGMGLAISRAIVEAHGGSIEVTSQPGQGSVFSFSLPMPTAQP